MKQGKEIIRVRGRLKVKMKNNVANTSRLTSRDLEITLDDKPVPNLFSLNLLVESGTAVRAEIVFYPVHIDIDSRVLADITRGEIY